MANPRPGCTTHARRASSSRGSVATATAWYSTGCAGPRLSARAARTSAAGVGPTAATSARAARRRRPSLPGRSSAQIPLTVWSAVCWAFASQKDGASALRLQRTLETGSYQTARAMLHRLRAAMVRPGRDRLIGTVEIDETLIGGVTPGKRGRTPGAKVLVPWSARSRGGFGRCRLAVLPDASACSLRTFLADHVEPGSTVVTDSWPPLPTGPQLLIHSLCELSLLVVEPGLDELDRPRVVHPWRAAS